VADAARGGKGNPSARYTEALERGVFTSALSAQEIPDINRLSAFRHLTEDHGLRPDKLAIAGVGKLWRALQDSTNFRESLFRLAAYLDYVDKIEGGKPQLKVGYGASVPQDRRCGHRPQGQSRAARARSARRLRLHLGRRHLAARYLIPFWSWMEINTRRYWRLTANAYTTSKGRGIATGGLLGASVAARTGLALYIRMALVYACSTCGTICGFPTRRRSLAKSSGRSSISSSAGTRTASDHAAHPGRALRCALRARLHRRHARLQSVA
jgi:hypothetical protein